MLIKLVEELRLRMRNEQTVWNVCFPSKKSSVPKINLLSALLSPFVQLLPNASHSFWKSWHSPHPNRASSAVNSTATL